MAEPAVMEFQFVNSTVESPSVPQDATVRAMIRKQAMKKASAARRRDGNYGKHNLRQFPVFVVSHEMKDKALDSWKTGTQDGHNVLQSGLKDVAHIKGVRTGPNKQERRRLEWQQWLTKLALSESLSAGMSAKGYELMSMKSDFDILNLATLTTLHVGRAVRAALSQNPHHVVHQLRSGYDPHGSYLAFLPSRYGQTGCLSDAANCVIARARYIITPNNNWEMAVFHFYGKALRSLQDALNHPEQCYLPEVLCATEILALYELLDPSGEGGWIRHTAGAAKLIQLRGPLSYSSDFEQALFMSHTVPIMTECLLNGERCFLEQKAWQKVFEQSVKEPALLSDRSEIVVTLMKNKSFIPGKFADITSIICFPNHPDTPDPVDVASRLRVLRAEFLKWNSRYAQILDSIVDLRPPGAEYDSHCKVYATYLSCLMISTRLLAALCPAERLELESTAQSLVDEMFKLEQEVKCSSVKTSLFMATTLGVAQTIRLTMNDWCDPNDEDSSGMISRWKLERWAGLIGRKMPKHDKVWRERSTSSGSS